MAREKKQTGPIRKKITKRVVEAAKPLPRPDGAKFAPAGAVTFRLADSCEKLSLFKR